MNIGLYVTGTISIPSINQSISLQHTQSMYNYNTYAHETISMNISFTNSFVLYGFICCSWGEAWGDKGYVMLKGGKNTCGLTTIPTYTSVSKSKKSKSKDSDDDKKNDKSDKDEDEDDDEDKDSKKSTNMKGASSSISKKEMKQAAKDIKKEAKQQKKASKKSAKEEKKTAKHESSTKKSSSSNHHYTH